MLVLFTGGRGSGKSTISRHLYVRLDSIGFEYVHQSSWRDMANNNFQKALSILYFLIFFRFGVVKVYFSRLYRDIRNRRSKGSLARIYSPFAFCYHLWSIARNKNQCVIYDSDFLTWAADKALNDQFRPEEVVRFYDRHVLPSVKRLVIVVCETPVEISIQRWQSRDSKNLSPAEMTRQIALKTAWKDARNEVISAVSSLDSVTVINLNGLKSPDFNAKKNSGSYYS